MWWFRRRLFWTTFAEFEDLSAFCDGVPMIKGPPKHRFRVLFLFLFSEYECFKDVTVFTMKDCESRCKLVPLNQMFGETNLLLSFSWSSKTFSLFLLPLWFLFFTQFDPPSRLSTNYHNKIKHVQPEIRSSTCFFCYNFKFILNLMLKRFGFRF